MAKIFLRPCKGKYIKILFHSSIRNMCLSSRAVFMFYWNSENYELFPYDMAWFIDIMKKTLGEVLKFERRLEAAFLEQDIGYIHNQIEADELPYSLNGKRWEEYDYSIFCGEKNNRYFAIWLYNNDQGEIVLHITEKYDESLKKEGITYKKFMKNFKPVLTEIIPHQVIRKWLAQCEYLEWQLKENERWWDEIEHPRLRAAGKCEECNEEQKNN